MVQAHGGRSRAQPLTLSLGAAMTQPPPAKTPAKKHVRLQERRSLQTLSAPKTWTSLATPPRTDTRPSCQIPRAVSV
ncbi:PTPN7 isoform 6 [Pan troglodytes]|uniref:PTPN7 isoform 6 n=2 Tax=Hominidae TaxID=9604 RepID=A0A2J8UXG5_PONAB|nr:PTPN7 isoform 6 [Pan troglodytes]PNJ49961.1 PTPN7 isoform 6 [Pongo abelii]